MSPAVSTNGLSRLCAASTTVKNSLTLALAGTSGLGGLRIVVTRPGKTPEVQSAACSCVSEPATTQGAGLQHNQFHTSNGVKRGTRHSRSQTCTEVTLTE